MIFNERNIKEGIGTINEDKQNTQHCAGKRRKFITSRLQRSDINLIKVYGKQETSQTSVSGVLIAYL